MSRRAEYQFVPTDVGTIEEGMTARLEEFCAFRATIELIRERGMNA